MGPELLDFDAPLLGSMEVDVAAEEVLCDVEETLEPGNALIVVEAELVVI